MAKNLQYVKVFEALQAAKGPVTVSDVKAIPGIVSTRLSTYLWEIKKNTGFAVKSNRDGRTVVSYELIGSGTAPVAPVAKPATPKVAKAKAPKATKANATAKTVAPASVKNDALSQNKVVDVLDEMDTDIVDFEDRAFAADYVKGM
jgi:hypothetical protein